MLVSFVHDSSPKDECMLQARTSPHEERCMYSRMEDAVLMAISAGSPDAAQAKLPTMVPFSAWWETASGAL